MKKIIIDILAILVFTIIFSTLCTIHLDTFFISTIYSVVGVMISIGLSLIVTFNMGGIRNKDYIQTIRQNLKIIRNKFIGYFTLSTIFYILNYYIYNQIEETQKENYNFATHLFMVADYKIQFDFSIFTSMFILLSILYIVVNFIELQKLNNGLLDKMNKQ